MIKILSVIIYLFLVSSSAAQKIYFCKSYTDKGEPIELINPNNITVGDNVCILVQTPVLLKENELIFFNIDQIYLKERQNQFNRVFKITNTKKWFVTFYKFIKGGNYEVFLSNSEKKKLSKSTFSLKPAEEEPAEPAQDEYYKNIAANLYLRIVDNRPYDLIERISLSLKEEPFLFLQNDKPLGTDIIILKTWKKKADGKFSEPIYVKKYQTSSVWLNTFLKIKLDKVGEYKIMLFNHNELLIKTIYISVTE
jgi:hypothetical protein